MARSLPPSQELRHHISQDFSIILDNLKYFMRKSDKRRKRLKRIMAISIDGENLEEYRKTQEEYKKFLLKLLNIRREFSK